MDIAAIQHGTLVFERRIADSIAAVFHARTDLEIVENRRIESAHLKSNERRNRMTSIQGN
jgi:hypothetical protein